MTALRVALVATHPIQYQVPWFRALGERPEVDPLVLYAHVPTASEQGVGFGLAFEWDLPLLEGHRYEVLRNVAQPPALSTFAGCDTPEVGRVLQAHRIEAVIVNGWHTKSCLQALWASRRLGIPCIVRGDSNALRRRPLAIRLVHRVLLRQYSAFLVVGQANRAFYRANGVPDNKLFHAPHCVDNARFAGQAAGLEPHRGDLRAAWRLPADGCVLAFCGKLIPKKRPLDVLAALERIASGGPPLHVLLAGDGELRSACEQRARANRLPATFTGFLNQQEIARAYVASDALVLPSDAGETWGLVVNEAMACGRPAIVSDLVGCQPDLVLPGETGEVFACGDVDSLATAMGRMATDPGRVRVMGAGARNLVSSYSVEALVTGTLQALGFATRSLSTSAPA
jgi:glycosyltransferase involved in cell wall biosynthesis